MTAFTGWIVRDKGEHATLDELDSAMLPDLDTLVRVSHSSLNYKDALALQGRPGVLRTYPIIPGVDLVGEIVDTRHPDWHIGDEVVLTGAGAGEERPGGLAELSRQPGDDLVALPPGFSRSQAAAVGTAGFTAALCLLALERAGVTPEAGQVLVTGAGGGVGSTAIALLAASGYAPVAVTGRPEELRDRLTGLGAVEVLGRKEVETPKPLAKQRWAGVVDAVGGLILAGALASLHHSGVATTCGLAAGAEFPGNVMPFILRGVSLIGVDSVRTSPQLRRAAWERIGRDLRPDVLDSLARTVGLADVQPVAEAILAGHGTGRTVVEIDPSTNS